MIQALIPKERRESFPMSRKLCSLYLALSVLISTVSIAYADSTPDIHSTEQDYQQAVAVLEDIGLQSGFDSGRTSMDRLYSSGLPAGAQSASLSQLQLMALDEMEAEEEAQQVAREQVADNLALLAQYDGVKLSADATLYTSGADSTATDDTIESGKVARLKGIDETGRWYLVTFGDSSGYVSADVCTPVSYADYDDTDAVRTQAEIDARAKAAAVSSASVSFGSGVVSGGSSLRSAVVEYAYTFLGIPYVYGGASRSGTDCSGLTMQIYGHYGISLSHGSNPQYYQCEPVSRSALQPGDLVFFYYGIGHVGIYVGGGQFIHASDYGVQVDSLYSSHWSSSYYGGGRIISG